MPVTAITLEISRHLWPYFPLLTPWQGI